MKTTSKICSNYDIERIKEITVIEPEIVKNSNVEIFYEWLVKCGNIHLNNNEMVVRSFHKIATY